MGPDSVMKHWDFSGGDGSRREQRAGDYRDLETLWKVIEIGASHESEYLKEMFMDKLDAAAARSWLGHGQDEQGPKNKMTGINVLQWNTTQ